MIADQAAKELWDGYIGRYPASLFTIDDHFHLLFVRAAIAQMKKMIETISIKKFSQIQSSDNICSDSLRRWPMDLYLNVIPSIDGEQWENEFDPAEMISRKFPF